MAAEALISNNAYMTSICIRLLLTCRQSLTQFAHQSITIGAKALSALADTPSRFAAKLSVDGDTSPIERSRCSPLVGLSIASAAESDQNVKRAPTTGAVLFLFK
jgi:hypothetical protein